MANDEKEQSKNELTDQNLDQASGGNNINQLWGDWFMPDTSERPTDVKTVETSDDPVSPEREDR